MKLPAASGRGIENLIKWGQSYGPPLVTEKHTRDRGKYGALPGNRGRWGNIDICPFQHPDYSSRFRFSYLKSNMSFSISFARLSMRPRTADLLTAEAHKSSMRAA